METMAGQRRFFQLDEQGCIIHVPDRPNGFALFLIGDGDHFVNEQTSFWLEHPGRRQWLEDWLERGYTVFSSHLYGWHWGSPKAVRLARQLIYSVLKSEIVNQRIYIVAEGVGALVALQLLGAMPSQIRAVAMINPCLDVRAQLDYEQEHPFVYRRMVREIATAYGLKEEEVPEAVPSLFLSPHDVPVTIWQLAGVSPYPSALHSRKYEQWMKTTNNRVRVVYELPEKRRQLARQIGQFFCQYNELP
ncbi:hypothetical protein P4474_11245 [Geobacillus stearothermophilus]|uniref:hypothetical protein n=1 Tax=Geobacillus stearothermophilus TaxID=1422 RepID=UPI00066FD122|nr:hypothetical protein [Geobacillus stearothermophilus]KMY61970.1 hypothetical protein AA906_02925 [Geobacillus stearothermophilus]MED3665050.1 hypothetical protein [Geobacillus stearothermophilus]